MRVFLRDVVDISQNVDMQSLGYAERIITSIRYQFNQSKYFTRRRRKLEEQKTMIRLEREENLKTILLYHIYNDLVKNRNKAIRQHKQVAKTIVIEVEREFEDILDNVIKGKDFLSYNIYRIQENPDMLLAQPNLPIRLRISKKVL